MTVSLLSFVLFCRILRLTHKIQSHVVEESANIQESDLRKARFWQGLQGLSESSLSSGRGKVRTRVDTLRSNRVIVVNIFNILHGFDSVGAYLLVAKADATHNPQRSTDDVRPSHRYERRLRVR